MTEINYLNLPAVYGAAADLQSIKISQRLDMMKMAEFEKEAARKEKRNSLAKDFFSPGQAAQNIQPQMTPGQAPGMTGNALAAPSYQAQSNQIPAIAPKQDYQGYANALMREGDTAGAQEMEGIQQGQRASKMSLYKPLYENAVSSGNNEAFQQIVGEMKREGLLPAEFSAAVLPTGEVESVITVTEGSVNPSTGQPWIDPVSGGPVAPGQYTMIAKGGRVTKIEPYQKAMTAANATERLDIARERLDLEKSRTAMAAQKGKRLPTKEINGLNDLQGSVERLDSLGRAFKGEYGGKTILGGLNTKIKDIGGMDTGQVNWWKDYKELDAIRRNAIFGASLTGNEKSSWDAITVNERSDPKTIQQAVANRVRIISEAYNRKIKNFEKGGYDVEEFSPLSVPESEGFAGGKTAPTSVSGPKVGEVKKGYRFKGGDPSKKESWEKAN